MLFQVIGCQARRLQTIADHDTFVDEFCGELRKNLIYGNALIVGIIEVNNNQTVGLALAERLKRYAPLYIMNQADVTERNGNIMMTAEDERKFTLQTKNPGIFTGMGVMSKVYYAVQMLAVVENNRMRRSSKLIGRDAEECWKLLIKEMTHLSVFVDVSEKRPHFLNDKLTISGKKTAAEGDDVILALMILVASAFVNLRDANTLLSKFCAQEQRSYTSS